MRSCSRQTSSDSARRGTRGGASAAPGWLSGTGRCAGFTLLEVTIAMTFVAVLISGIALTITTCLKVWDRSRESAEFNQETRAIIEVLSRDIRGAYLGLNRRGGYFVAEGGSQAERLAPTLEFTTESSSVVRAALLPESDDAAGDEALGEPVTDFVAVRYELLDESQADRPGLYRTTWVAPSADWLESPPAFEDALGTELISTSVVDLRLRYWDGETWLDSWATTAENLQLPQAVAIQLSLLDVHGNEHILESVILVPVR